MGVTGYFTCARVMGSLTRGLYATCCSGFFPSLAGPLLGACVQRCAAVADAGAPSRVPAARRALGGAVMRVLVACEFSGVVRDAFRARGHDVVSCDLLPSELPGSHLQMDVRRCLGWNWDLIVAHPPCTHLAVSGARWFPLKRAEQAVALDFVRLILAAPCPRIALENPVSIISSRVRRPDQVIQPWQFGHGEVKATCLWLKGLPRLVPSHVVSGRVARVHRLPPGPDRWRERSRTFQGVADAMAEQWGSSRFALQAVRHG